MTDNTQDLAALIKSRLLGRTYAQLARDCGSITKATVHRLATKPLVDMPSTATLKAIALGLKVSQGAVVQAAAESVGIVTDTEGKQDLVIHGAGNLPLPVRMSILVLSQQFLDYQRLTETRGSEPELQDPAH